STGGVLSFQRSASGSARLAGARPASPGSTAAWRKGPLPMVAVLVTFRLSTPPRLRRHHQVLDSPPLWRRRHDRRVDERKVAPGDQPLVLFLPATEPPAIEGGQDIVQPLTRQEHDVLRDHPPQSR